MSTKIDSTNTTSIWPGDSALGPTAAPDETPARTTRQWRPTGSWRSRALESGHAGGASYCAVGLRFMTVRSVSVQVGPVVTPMKLSTWVSPVVKRYV